MDRLCLEAQTPNLDGPLYTPNLPLRPHFLHYFNALYVIPGKQLFSIHLSFPASQPFLMMTFLSRFLTFPIATFLHPKLLWYTAPTPSRLLI